MSEDFKHTKGRHFKELGEDWTFILWHELVTERQAHILHENVTHYYVFILFAVCLVTFICSLLIYIPFLFAVRCYSLLREHNFIKFTDIHCSFTVIWSNTAKTRHEFSHAYTLKKSEMFRVLGNLIPLCHSSSLSLFYAVLSMYYNRVQQEPGMLGDNQNIW